MTKALYTGSFDPMTNGHMDIITRSSKMFDELVVGVIVNPGKSPLFSREERVEMIERVTKHLGNVTVDSFQGLLADYVNKNRFDAVVRGLRATTDFEYEIQMAQMNRKLYPKAETIFLMTNPIYAYLSSSLVKEVAGFSGCVSDLIPELAYKKLIEKLHDERDDF